MSISTTPMWHAGGQNAEQMRDLLTLALNRSGVAAVMMRDAGDFVFVVNLPDCWEIPENARPTRDSVFGREIGSRISDIAADTINTGEPNSFETTGPDDRYFEFGIDRVSAGSDRFLLLTVMELTEERWREQRLRVLLREVSHRSKNLLAIILSVASQTAKTTIRLDDFLLKFRGRVYSISHSQDLITDANWHGAYFRDLVLSQADKYHERPEQTLTVEGANPMLSPNEALHLGLAIHELFVDAIALGEYSDEFPAISVSCSEKRYDGGPGLEIIWRQKNPPDVTDEEFAAASEDGFQSNVLNRITPSALGGEGHYELGKTGPVYEIHFPKAD